MSTLTIVMDISGSMMEMAKILCAENLIGYVQESVANQETVFTNTSLFYWNHVFVPATDAVPQPGGRSSLSAFAEWIQQGVSESILVLSDGSFLEEEVLQFKNNLTQMGFKGVIRTIAIGIDSQFDVLQLLSTEEQYFHSYEIDTVLLTPFRRSRLSSPRQYRKVLALL